MIWFLVDNARKMICRTIDIAVTSVPQTTAGRMSFGRHIDPGMIVRATAPVEAAVPAPSPCAAERVNAAPSAARQT